MFRIGLIALLVSGAGQESLAPFFVPPFSKPLL
jgi:hypothetical protein